ncbi:MFS transporter [Caldimonas tepidiphila]|uniref:MFS transporter n=1 Tax=Caldimonas tepidiphila TaxID=2315841 RepID=UPI00196AA8F5|nr:MFS transporter [Caldimonas tepidiphila]
MAPDSLLSFRAFLQFWWARLAGTSANQMMMVAVGWQMYDLTGSAWDLGLVGLLQFLPALALTLVAGHVADRFRRERVLALCMAAQLAVVAVLLAATQGGWASRDLLLGLSLALGGAKAFQMPSQQALAPLLVPAAVLPRALAFSSAGMQGAIIAGPAIGGFIYVAGASAVYTVCALLFALAAALLLRLRYDHEPPPREPVTLASLLAGVRYIRERRVVLGAISLDLFAVLLGGATALLPIFAKDVLHVGPWGLGLLRGAPAVGALLMSIALTRWPITRRAGALMFAAVAVYGVATLVFALSEVFALSLAALAVSGAADMVSVVIRQSLVQLETPDAMRGRVSAVNSVFIGASNQLGEFESGATAALLGPVGSVVLGGAGTLLVAGLWMRLFPELARREKLAQG